MVNGNLIYFQYFPITKSYLIKLLTICVVVDVSNTNVAADWSRPGGSETAELLDLNCQRNHQRYHLKWAVQSEMSHVT